MRAKYFLTDEQKERIRNLNEQIFELEMKIASIYSMARVRYITESEEECENVRKYLCYTDNPLKTQGIVKINESEVVNHD